MQLDNKLRLEDKRKDKMPEADREAMIRALTIVNERKDFRNVI